MSNVQVQPLTDRDYRELPETGPRYQLIEGELHMSPSPNLFHQLILGNIHFLLSSHLKQHPNGIILCAPIDVYLTETNVFQPDLLYVARQRASILKKDGVHGAPDLVIEILSPATKKFDLGSKMRTYAQCGVREYWAVDPESERIEIYRFEQSSARPVAVCIKEAIIESNLFSGLRIAAIEIFSGQPD